MIEMMEKIWNRKNRIVGVLAFLLTFMQVCGYQISMKYGTTMHRLSFWLRLRDMSGWKWALLGGAEFLVWNLVLNILFRLLDNRKEIMAESREKGRGWLCIMGTALLLLLCWLPSLLGCYPGFYNYDIGGQVPQVMYEEVPYSTHHPLLHTLIAGGIINWGYHLSGESSLEFGVLLYSIFSMMVCAVCFGISVWYIWKLAGKKWLTTAAFCYYAFFPTIILFSMSTTKDVFCSVAALICVVLVHEMYSDMDSFFHSRKKIVIFLVVTVICCLFRNNVIYAVVALFICSVLFYKKCVKQQLLLLCGIFMLYVGCNQGMIMALNAETGNTVEALSVPLQQIARLYNEEGEEAFSEEELILLYDLIDAKEFQTYDPLRSDNIKSSVKEEALHAGWSDYLKLWISKGFRYPGTYAMAFLDNTFQAWYPWTSMDDPKLRHLVSYFDFEDIEPVEKSSKIPALYEFYYKISYEYSYQKYPVIRLLFSVGTMFWVALFTWFYGIWKKDKAVVFALSFVLLLCMTFFLGPISLVRYYLILFYGFPVCLGFLWKRQAADIEE